MNVLVIGAGNMGIPLAKSISKSQKHIAEVGIYDRTPEKVIPLDQQDGLKAYTRLEDCLPKASIIFLAIKPNDSASFFDTIRSLLHKDQILVSIMAGVTLERLTSQTNLSKVIRMMPNLPAIVGEGISTFVRTKEVSDKTLAIITELLRPTGEVLEVASEKLVDASTSISGTGPAYVFYFMKCLIESATELGFSQEQAEKLVSQTFKGSIHLFYASTYSPESWIQKVASKGGTTEAALEYLKNEKVNDLVKEAARQAFLKSQELGKDY